MAKVKLPLEGVIDTFHVQPNEKVSAGQALFGFDEALIQSKLEVSRQTQATAEAEYRQAAQQALTEAGETIDKIDGIAAAAGPGPASWPGPSTCLGARPGATMIPRERQDWSYQRHDRLGYNFRMSAVQAALGLAQVERLDYLDGNWNSDWLLTMA